MVAGLLADQPDRVEGTACDDDPEDCGLRDCSDADCLECASCETGTDEEEGGLESDAGDESDVCFLLFELWEECADSACYEEAWDEPWER